MRSAETRVFIIIFTLVNAAACVAAAIIDLRALFVCLAAGILSGAAFAVCETKRKNKVNRLNDYLDLVCSGNYELDISDNAEGELSVLKNNIYKVVVMLKCCNEELSKEKLFLADSLTDISHQLKTPLTSMVVMTDLLKEEKDGERSAEYVGIMDTQLRKMGWLIQNLLKIAKLDAGTAEMAKAQTDIKSVIDESLKPFALTLELKNIEILRRDEAFTFTGDLNWCAEAVQNVIKNCIEHTESGGVISFSTSCSTIYNELVISDNGCGIPEDELPHIFERFYRGKNKSSDSVGIGLALAKEIMLKQGAKIEAESAPGRGTSFIFKFYKTVV